MRSLRHAPLVVVLAVALGVLLLVFPGRRELIAHVFTLVAAAILLFGLLHLLRASLPPARPSAFDAALRRTRPRQTTVPDLAQLEREVTLVLMTSFDVHFRFRPTLRSMARELLASRRGIDLDLDREAARRVLGEEAWEIVRPDREAPTDRFGPGIDLPTVRATVTALEAI
jgi:hypothetical protein